MQLALGRTVEEEYMENSHCVAKHLRGPDRGLLFTNKSLEETKQFFKDFSKPDYARSGFLASETVRLEAGPLPQFSHSLEPHLRSLGLPTTLQNGI